MNKLLNQMTLKKITDQVAPLLSNADALLMTADAGISVDSGLPDFKPKVFGKPIRQ